MLSPREVVHTFRFYQLQKTWNCLFEFSKIFASISCGQIHQCVENTSNCRKCQQQKCKL